MCSLEYFIKRIDEIRPVKVDNMFDLREHEKLLIEGITNLDGTERDQFTKLMVLAIRNKGVNKGYDRCIEKFKHLSPLIE